MPVAFFLYLTGEMGKASLFRKISAAKALRWMHIVLRQERRPTRRPDPIASQEENSGGS